MKLLEGKGIRLTRFQAADTDVYRGFLDDATFARNLSATPYRFLSDEKINGMLASDAHETFRFAVRRTDAERLIGIVSLEDILWSNGTAWLMIGIDLSETGKGYGRKALQLLLRYAFYELNLERIQLTVFAYNERAIALYERLGFVHEGTYRQFLKRDGKRHDMLLYGLLQTEWEDFYD
ncbi:GNAT family protein [Exiguobacterium sp. s127]|uniref:GNAT family N-acetyltransferase n=1 Tax=Exiguobacterium sp. s127 TaxID=2751210 RepID=UPI0033386128